jgi:VanZ family protein
VQPPNRYFHLAFLWFIICTWLFTLPGTVLPKEDFLDKIWFDKWVHIGLFTVLIFLVCTGVYKRKKHPSAGLVYGIIIEFVQKYYIPFRSFDVGDIIADGVGCFIGFAFASKRYIKK